MSRPKGLPVRHPDTIPGLEPDCRRVLRDEYQIIQARAGRTPLDEISVHDAIAEYRRVATMWGVDVEVRS